MAARKKQKTANVAPQEDAIVPKTKHPLVFISHDTRDAELAEEFSNLLKSASAGALKSFRSSDKKGTQGIEYGLEWYPAIMDKIDEASEVVCLLTQRSVDRPWILYEAGVAKGKLNKAVIGVALGIPHSVAFTGPFAQFQNNDGSVDSITKLVLDLVRKVPGLDPDTDLVGQLVEAFHQKANEIIATHPKKKENAVEEPNENIVAKLFEEVKIMFESLPSRIENRIDPDIKRRRRKFHPMMLEELMHFGFKSEDPNLSFLMLISFFKEDFPWLYEIGVDTYRTLKNSKSKIERKKAITNFERAFEMFGHPMMKEFYGRSEDTYMFYKEFRHIMRRYLEQFFHDGGIDQKE
jgi:hypothetical protein